MLPVSHTLLPLPPPSPPGPLQPADEEYGSELMDSGADDDDWEPGEEDYRSEPASTAEAAAAAAAAMAAGRRRGQDTSGLIVLGKRRRGRQRADSDGDEFDELYADDDEVKGEQSAGKGRRNCAVCNETWQLRQAALNVCVKLGLPWLLCSAESSSGCSACSS